MKISSIFVAFLENMNFTILKFWFQEIFIPSIWHTFTIALYIESLSLTKYEKYRLSLALLCAGLPPTIYVITQDSLEESGVTLVWHNGQKSKDYIANR